MVLLVVTLPVPGPPPIASIAVLGMFMLGDVLSHYIPRLRDPRLSHGALVVAGVVAVSVLALTSGGHAFGPIQADVASGVPSSPPGPSPEQAGKPSGAPTLRWTRSSTATRPAVTICSTWPTRPARVDGDQLADVERWLREQD